jgi:hypothetical protein
MRTYGIAMIAAVVENFDFLPDTEFLENICENEKDAVHRVGK